MPVYERITNEALVVEAIRRVRHGKIRTGSKPAYSAASMKNLAGALLGDRFMNVRTLFETLNALIALDVILITATARDWQNYTKCKPVAVVIKSLPCQLLSDCPSHFGVNRDHFARNRLHDDEEGTAFTIDGVYVLDDGIPRTTEQRVQESEEWSYY